MVVSTREFTVEDAGTTTRPGHVDNTSHSALPSIPVLGDWINDTYHVFNRRSAVEFPQKGCSTFTSA